MTRSNLTIKERARFINIGFFEPDFTREFKTYKEKIVEDGVTYRFVADHEMPQILTRYGRWIKSND